MTKGAPLLFSRTGSWFSDASKNRIITLALPALSFRRHGTDGFLAYADERGNRLVVARRIEQLHGGSAVRVPADFDPLPEVARGGGGGEPELEQLLHEMRARRRRVALPIRDDHYGLLARRALLHEPDVRPVLEVAGALDQVVQCVGLDVLVSRRLCEWASSMKVCLTTQSHPISSA